MTVRDHQGWPLDAFNGLWDRGDVDEVPPDHFSACNNIDFFAQGSFRTRPAVNISQDVLVPLSNIRRIYNYPTQNANTLIVLTYDYDVNQGSIYHVVDRNTIYGPILQIANMTDFAFVPFAGRGYISPFGNYTNGDLIFQRGLQNEFLYVYDGLGNHARKAAGAGMTGAMTIANGTGSTDAGLHIFGFVSQTISGYNCPPSLLQSFTTSPANGVSFGSIPTSGDPTVVKRLLVASKVITDFNGNLNGYPLFFVPNATIENNTDTFLNNISFYDASLLDDASHLANNYTSIPAGAVLGSYHNRLCLAATHDDISIVLVSEPGEPEAISQLTGLIIFPLDGNPITNLQEMRDILYLFKRTKCIGYSDNGGDPSSWLPNLVDEALGASVHGISTVLDSGGTTVDFLIIANYQGTSLFNGKFITPELTWKMSNYWAKLDRNQFGNIQMVNIPTKKRIYMILPNRRLLVGNYENGMDYKNIRWGPSSLAIDVNTVGVQNIDTIILGCDII